MRLVPNQSSETSDFSNKRGGLIAIGAVVLTAAALFGGYHLVRFLIDWSAATFSANWITASSVPVWIVCIVILLLGFAILRTLTTYLAKLLKYVFKIAQSDVVTVILACVANVLLSLLNGWISYHLLRWIDSSGIDSFYSLSNPVSAVVMFLMLLGALVWTPRIGVYGENKLGQFDEEPEGR